MTAALIERKKEIRPEFISMLLRFAAAVAFYIANVSLIYYYKNIGRFLHFNDIESAYMGGAAYSLLIAAAIFTVVFATRHGALHFGISLLIAVVYSYIFPKGNHGLEALGRIIEYGFILVIELIFLAAALLIKHHLIKKKLIKSAAGQAPKEAYPHIRKALENSEDLVYFLFLKYPEDVQDRLSDYVKEQLGESFIQQYKAVEDLAGADMFNYRCSGAEETDLRLGENGETVLLACDVFYTSKIARFHSFSVCIHYVCICAENNARVGAESISIFDMKTGKSVFIGMTGEPSRGVS